MKKTVILGIMLFACSALITWQVQKLLPQTYTLQSVSDPSRKILHFAHEKNHKVITDNLGGVFIVQADEPIERGFASPIVELSAAGLEPNYRTPEKFEAILTKYEVQTDEPRGVLAGYTQKQLGKNSIYYYHHLNQDPGEIHGVILHKDMVVNVYYRPEHRLAAESLLKTLKLSSWL